MKPGNEPLKPRSLGGVNHLSVLLVGTEVTQFDQEQAPGFAIWRMARPRWIHDVTTSRKVSRLVAEDTLEHKNFFS
jgi:hypothetical protein